ncbi:MAG: pyridoxal-phosphate dependent enzyme, partial [Clostridia bacterium]|nr:pyridoxal-phosphate dependent enzyme [Clostridia bacterium]
MGRVYKSIDECVGSTPLIELGRVMRAHGLGARLLAKVEGANPWGSAKDRVALAMIEDAERRGTLRRGSVIVEPTSGNTGVALAAVAALKGYEAVIVMPDSASKERVALIRAYGGRVEYCDGRYGMRGALARARELVGAIEGAVMLGQFENPANPRAHFCTTAVELWRDSKGELDALVAGVGTGGVITGIGRYLKS